MKYMIVSGYFARPGMERAMGWMYRTWYENTYTHAKPARTFIIAQGGCKVSMFHKTTRTEWIYLDGDTGSCDDLLKGRKYYPIGGAGTVWMLGAALAYANECDLIYKEQDCLAFGDWVEKLYREMGDGMVCFGNGRLHGGSSTSIFLVRHRYLPFFMADYIGEGRENVPTRIPEHKFKHLAQRWPEHYRQHTMGYDTDRPFDPTHLPFYLQKITQDEMRLLAEHKLIFDLAEMPDAPIFTNTLE